jgi:hypothetical protein
MKNHIQISKEGLRVGKNSPWVEWNNLIQLNCQHDHQTGNFSVALIYDDEKHADRKTARGISMSANECAQFLTWFGYEIPFHASVLSYPEYIPDAYFHIVEKKIIPLIKRGELALPYSLSFIRSSPFSEMMWRTSRTMGVGCIIALLALGILLGGNGLMFLLGSAVFSVLWIRNLIIYKKQMRATEE